jgi:predicted unusual protein kinase regulating ubiquinone biosynthesis (AarF/ABC1/UbiB family)
MSLFTTCLLYRLLSNFPSFRLVQVINDELGAPWYEIYADLTPEPIAAASLGQVYRGRLKTGEEVAVKVQRPGVLVSLRALQQTLLTRRLTCVTCNACGCAVLT